MLGITNQSKLDKVFVTLFLGLFFTFGSAFAEVTQSGGVINPPRDAQTCRGTIKVQQTAHIYSSVNGAKLGLEYSKGFSVKFASIDGNWAEVRWINKNRQVQRGYVQKDSFSQSDWQSARSQCLNDNRHLYESRGSSAAAREGQGLYSENRTEPGISTSVQQADITCEFNHMKKFYNAKNRQERYAVINKQKRAGKMFRSYVIDMRTGKVVDNFDSLIGYNGMGCGKGQTRPGIYKIGSKSGRGASRKPWWGNGHRYQVIQNIGGSSRQWGGRGCGVYYQHVAHSNKNMNGASAGRQRYSAGCFVTSPQKFNKWTRAQAGNMLIYNVDRNTCN